jgi:hypothetical protein
VALTSAANVTSDFLTAYVSDRALDSALRIDIRKKEKILGELSVFCLGNNAQKQWEKGKEPKETMGETDAFAIQTTISLGLNLGSEFDNYLRVADARLDGCPLCARAAHRHHPDLSVMRQ